MKKLIATSDKKLATATVAELDKKTGAAEINLSDESAFFGYNLESYAVAESNETSFSIDGTSFIAKISRGFTPAIVEVTNTDIGFSYNVSFFDPAFHQHFFHAAFEL